MSSTNYRPQFDPTVPRSESGVYPAVYVPNAMLKADGLTIVGWVPAPPSGWEPEGLLWSPPGAKSGPDVFGSVQDATTYGSVAMWVRAQLDRRRSFLDKLRAAVLAGKLHLTSAAVAKLLGLPFDDGVELVEPPGALLRQVNAEYDRFAGRWIQ